MRIGLLLIGLTAMLMGGGSGGWKSLAPGMDLGTFVTNLRSPAGDSRVTVLRMDPDLWDLEFAGVSQDGESAGRTARQWCQQHNFTAAINAGMFATDYKIHVGYLKSRGHVNNGHVNTYQSVAAFDPVEGKHLPRFRIFDLDDTGVTMASIPQDYTSAVQNLRLVKRPGSNRWGKADKRWSEAALGEDSEGRILFIFSRSPYTMYELSHELLSMDIGLVAAQHLEGGPEAQIYLKAGGIELEMFGSYETSFREKNDNTKPWPIPNVL